MVGENVSISWSVIVIFGFAFCAVEYYYFLTCCGISAESNPNDAVEGEQNMPPQDVTVGVQDVSPEDVSVGVQDMSPQDVSVGVQVWCPQMYL